MSQRKYIQPADPKRLAAQAAKEKHKQRKADPKPKAVTNDMLYDMILELNDRLEHLESKN